MFRAALVILMFINAPRMALSQTVPSPTPIPGQVAAPAPAQLPIRPPAAPIPSLMFTDVQVKQIQRAIAAHEAQIANVNNAGNENIAADAADAVGPGGEMPNIYVSAVLDLGGGRWTVWANGLRITPTHQPPLFSVAAVSGDSVEIVVPGDSGGRFRLRPFQTWVSSKRDVVDGIVP
jgi:hypothetical protein